MSSGPTVRRTAPGLLASFVVIRPGDHLVTLPDATSELYYCLRGSGYSQFERSDASDAPRGAGGSGATAGTGRIPWRAGDFLTLPSGCTTTHRADGAEGSDRADAGDGASSALLYRVTDAPLLRYLGAAPVRPRFAPTRFDGATARARLAEVERDPAAAERSRVSLLLGNTATPQTLTVTHTLWAMLGVLPVGRVQRPHRHQSVALDLITACAPGCYSLLGSRLDPDGAIVDPVRVDWEAEGAFVTPPGSGTAITTSPVSPPIWCPSRMPDSTPTSAPSTSGSTSRTADHRALRQRAVRASGVLGSGRRGRRVRCSRPSGTARIWWW